MTDSFTGKTTGRGKKGRGRGAGEKPAGIPGLVTLSGEHHLAARDGHGLAGLVFLLNDVEDRTQNVNALGARRMGTFAS